MIFICSDLQKFQLVTILQFKTYISKCLIYCLIEHSATIFRWKYQVIKQCCYVMSLMYIFAHANILRPKDRGIKPGSD